MILKKESILKKDSKYGSRRELPALGVSGVVSKSRPSIFDFWESFSHSETISDEINYKSARRLLPPLP